MEIHTRTHTLVLINWFNNHHGCCLMYEHVDIAWAWEKKRVGEVDTLSIDNDMLFFFCAPAYPLHAPINASHDIVLSFYIPISLPLYLRECVFDSNGDFITPTHTFFIIPFTTFCVRFFPFFYTYRCYYCFITMQFICCQSHKKTQCEYACEYKWSKIEVIK